MKFFLILFIIPLELFAQMNLPKSEDLDGVWIGSLYNDTTNQYIHYELAISKNNSRLDGYSHTTFIISGQEYFGVKSLKIKIKKGQLLIEDQQLIYNNYPEAPSKGVKTFIELQYSENDSTEFLLGNWKTNRTKEYNALTGTLHLERKKRVWKTLIIPKLDQMGLAGKLSFLSDTATTSSIVKLDKETEGLHRSDLKEIETENNIDQPGKIIPDTTITEPEMVIMIHVDKNKKPKKANDEQESAATDKISVHMDSIKARGDVLNIPVSERSINNQYKKDSLRVKDVLPDKNLAAAEISKREIETIRTVEISNDSLVLSLYDNGTVDGDTVSILVNNKIAIPKLGLLEKAFNKTIYFTPDMGDSITIIMYAENLGSLAPNTGLLIVRDGKINYEIRFSGDLKRNSAIILKRKKK